MPDKVIVLRGPGNIVKTTASGVTSATTVVVSTTAGVSVGMSVTGEGIASTATVLTIGTNSVGVSAPNTAFFSDKSVFFTEWENLQVSGESIISASIFSTISASEAYISVSAEVAGFPVTGRITGTGSISTASWISAATPAFTVKSDFTVSGVSSSDYPQVNFNLDTYTVAVDAGVSFVASYTGGITLYADTTPSSTVSFDYIIVKG